MFSETAKRGFVRAKTLKFLDVKKQGAFSETAKRFQVKFFERFGKLFSKKFSKVLILLLSLRHWCASF
jgi:hypothetical protein